MHNYTKVKHNFERCQICRTTRRQGTNGPDLVYYYRKPHEKTTMVEPVCKAAPGRAATSQSSSTTSRPPPPRRIVYFCPPFRSPSPPPPVAGQKRNHFALVIDSSGSMDILQGFVPGFVDKQLKAIYDGAALHQQTGTVSLLTFGQDSNKDVKVVTPPTDFSIKIRLPHYYPGQGTPLMDAVGVAAATLDAIPKQSADESYVVMVITDGQENSSHMSQFHFSKLLSDKQATDRWTFAFMVPDATGKQVLENLGVPSGNITIWQQTKAGLDDVARHSGMGVNSYYVARATGATNTKKFFETDLSKVTTADLSKLTDLQTRFKGWTVDKETDIKTFIEEKGLPFYLGAAYYTLMKPETVQANKEILITEKGQKAVYGGQEARKLLGLPNYEVKVVPKNHAYFDVFVQSTSVNRKLVRGTRVLYNTLVNAHQQHTW